MANILDKIFDDKKEELAETKRRVTFAEIKGRLEQCSQVKNVRGALTGDVKAPSRIIAEIKRRTPFKGELKANFDAVEIALSYAENGAAAISILTEQRHFGGSIDYLENVRAEVSIPLLRKDFIFAEYQVYESRAFGADMFLLIATHLEKNHLADLMGLGMELGLTPLVEAHDEADMERAFSAGAKVIGINNRDLTSGKTDLGISCRLLKMAQMDPENIVVCESGIRGRSEIEELEKLGADAFLVGESLMRSRSVADKLRELIGDEKKAASG